MSKKLAVTSTKRTEARGEKSPRAKRLEQFAARANAAPELEEAVRAELSRMGWSLASTRWILVPHPPTSIGLNGSGNIIWARRKWWPLIESATNSQLIRQRITHDAPPQEYHVAWYYNIGVEPDDDNIWGRLKHVRDTIAAHFGMDDRHLHTGRCRCYKDKELAGYCIIILV